MTLRTFLKLMAVGAIFAAIIIACNTPVKAHADAITEIEQSGGHYLWAHASLDAADCSGLVSVAQTIEMGQPPHRLGDTRTLLAGHWPGAIPGADPGDQFIIGVNSVHMVASINGVNIESAGGPYRIGDAATSPFAPQFRQYHIDPALLVA